MVLASMAEVEGERAWQQLMPQLMFLRGYKVEVAQLGRKHRVVEVAASC